MSHPDNKTPMTDAKVAGIAHFTHRHRLKELKRHARHLERELIAARARVEEGEADFEAAIKKAVEVGLVPRMVFIEQGAELREKIKQVVAAALAPHLSNGTGKHAEGVRDKDGLPVVIGSRMVCDDEIVEVVSFHPEGVEVKFFDPAGGRRCYTEVRDADELEREPRSASQTGGTEG